MGQNVLTNFETPDITSWFFYQRSMYLSLTDLTLLCVPVHVCLYVLCCSCLVLFFEFVTSDFDYDVDYGLVLMFEFMLVCVMLLRPFCRPIFYSEIRCISKAILVLSN